MVDICQPPTMWVEGRCYRVNKEEEYTVTTGYTGEEDTGLYMEEHFDGDLRDSFHHQIEELGNNRFRVTLQVAATFFPQIIGKGGQTKNRLESDTRTKILIPKKGMEGDIVITGGDKRGVASAANRIDVVVAGARNKQPFTHFISIPMNTKQIQAAFLRFKEEVLDSCKSVRGLDKTIFQTETLLHLTVGTMALLDERERNMARELLMDCKEQILLPCIGDGNLEIELTGLEYMNDDPGEVDVLYCGVKDKEGKLQKVVERIVDKFVESGLMRREDESVKLHLTLLNTLFRRDQEEDLVVKAVGRPRESFDCRPVLEGWGSLTLGRVEVGEIHLSQRRAGRRTAEGYYLPSAIMVIGGCG